MEFNIAVMGGDGIGPEVTDQGVRALEAVGGAFGHSFNLSYGDIGGISIDKHGIPFTDEVRAMSGDNDAVLFGAVGGPKWDDPNAAVRPEQGLLDIRAHMGVFANIRPVKVYPWLADASPLKSGRAGRGGHGGGARAHRRPVLRRAARTPPDPRRRHRRGHHALH